MINIVSENDRYLFLLNEKARNKDLRNNRLAKIHIEIGESLGRFFISTLPEEKFKFKTSQNREVLSKSVCLNNLSIIVLMRAGFYLAQGLRNVIDNEDQIFHLSNNPSDIPFEYLKDRHVIVVDSVVNSGQTLAGYLDVVGEHALRVSCVCLVMQSDFYNLIDDCYKHIDFIISRVSKNSYVGKGATDTGNRLFGTFNR